jgi:hypothetical protein
MHRQETVKGVVIPLEGHGEKIWGYRAKPEKVRKQQLIDCLIETFEPQKDKCYSQD